MSPSYNFVVRLKSHYRLFHHFLHEYLLFVFVLVLLHHKFYCMSPMNPMYPIHNSLEKMMKYICIEKIFFVNKVKNHSVISSIHINFSVWHRLHNDNHYRQGKFRCYSFVAQRTILSILFRHFPRGFPLFLS